jgi:hypothetical protein
VEGSAAGDSVVALDNASAVDDDRTVAAGGESVAADAAARSLSRSSSASALTAATERTDRTAATERTAATATALADSSVVGDSDGGGGDGAGARIGAGENIRVIVRVRPLSDSEARAPPPPPSLSSGSAVPVVIGGAGGGGGGIWSVRSESGEIRCTTRERFGEVERTTATAFVFDSGAVVDGSTGTEALYDRLVRRQLIAQGFMSGINATVMAYGQTSAGKSYTMVRSRCPATLCLCARIIC